MTHIGSSSALVKLTALLILAALYVSGCGPSEQQIEGAITRELPELVGPAQNYTVDVQGVSGTRAADRIIVTGTRVRPEGAPVLDRVSVVLNDVVIDPQRAELERLGSADATLHVLSSDLAAHFEMHPNLRNVSVALQSPNRAVIRAQPEFRQLPIPSQATATITGNLVNAGDRVNFNVTEIEAAGYVLPDVAEQLLTEAVNPILDISRIPIALRITDLRVQENSLIIHASGTYPAGTTIRP